MLENGSQGQLGILIFKMAKSNFYKFKEGIIGGISFIFFSCVDLTSMFYSMVNNIVGISMPSFN